MLMGINNGSLNILPPVDQGWQPVRQQSDCPGCFYNANDQIWDPSDPRTWGGMLYTSTLPPDARTVLSQVYNMSDRPAKAAFVATGAAMAGPPLIAEFVTSAAGDYLFARGTGLLNSGPLRIGWSWWGNATWGLAQTYGQEVFRMRCRGLPRLPVVQLVALASAGKVKPKLVNG